MRPASLVFFVLTACGGAPPGPPALPSNTLAASPGVEPRCIRPPRPTEPLSRVELEHETVSADATTAHDQLLGVWDGYSFSLDGELGEPGSAPRAEDFEIMCFDPEGRVRTPERSAHVPAPRPGCSPRSRTYSLRREDEAGTSLVLEVRATGGCPGDAGYARPYLHPYYVHRLDDRFLVLVDGVTAAVSGYRRR